LLHCGPKERESANRIVSELQHPSIASMGIWEDLPIDLSKAVLRRADLVVSTDSGPRHMAVALNRPVVTLFGPTDPAWTHTYNRPEALLKSQKPQSVMADISVDEVFSAVVAQIDLGNRGHLPIAAA
jgi:heptosyltransferase-2